MSVVWIPRPRTLSRIKQERLSSKEQLRAVFHALELLELPYQTPTRRYLAADPANGLQRYTHENMDFLHDQNNGDAAWISFHNDPDLTRLVLNPDEGSALHAGYQFLASRSCPVIFRRDEL